MTSSRGRSPESVSTAEIASTTSIPEATRPKTVCFPSSHGARVGGDDEELAAVRVRAGVRHRERAALDPVLVGLVLELVAGPARAGAGRVTALDHEVGDDAVEHDAVVEALPGEALEVLDGLGRVGRVELELDRAVIGVERCVGHTPELSRPVARRFFPVGQRTRGALHRADRARGDRVGDRRLGAPDRALRHTPGDHLAPRLALPGDGAQPRGRMVHAPRDQAAGAGGRAHLRARPARHRRDRLRLHPDAGQPGQRLRAGRSRLRRRPDQGARPARLPRDEVPHRREDPRAGEGGRRLEGARADRRSDLDHEERGLAGRRHDHDRVPDVLHAARGADVDGAVLRPPARRDHGRAGGRSATTSTGPSAGT